jgi:hypothetical protein
MKTIIICTSIAIFILVVAVIAIFWTMFRWLDQLDKELDEKADDIIKSK